VVVEVCVPARGGGRGSVSARGWARARAQQLGSKDGGLRGGSCACLWSPLETNTMRRIGMRTTKL
jgi:hypothetical protein